MSLLYIAFPRFARNFADFFDSAQKADYNKENNQWGGLMNGVNRTLYIPLYGKAYVSRKGLILQDPTAERIWEKEGVSLGPKAKSKWLAYYMGMRSAIFDNWVREKLAQEKAAVVLHLGCGMDSRCNRVGTENTLWFDVDFPEVIAERRKYYQETDHYRMIASDVICPEYLNALPRDRAAVVVMEGISMYLQPAQLQAVLQDLKAHFEKVFLLMDCYTTFAAKASRYRNPINQVGVTQVYGLDEPQALANAAGISFVKAWEMTPQHMIGQLPKREQIIFRKLYAGGISRKMYRLYEFVMP